MVDEIRGRPLPNADYPQDDRLAAGRPGKAIQALLDKHLDGKRLVGEWWGEGPGEADPILDRDRAAFEELAFADEIPGRATVTNPEGPIGDDAESEGGSVQPGVGLPVAPNPFQLVGQLSTVMADGTVHAAGAPDFSRYHVAARVAEAAEALAVRVDAGRSEQEIKIEFKDDHPPGTSAVIRREEHGGKLAVEFATVDATVNVFLANSNASLRQQLADRFGCVVTVTVDYRPDGGRDGTADERGRERGRPWDEEGYQA